MWVIGQGGRYPIGFLRMSVRRAWCRLGAEPAGSWRCTVGHGKEQAGFGRLQYPVSGDDGGCSRGMCRTHPLCWGILSGDVQLADR